MGQAALFLVGASKGYVNSTNPRPGTQSGVRNQSTHVGRSPLAGAAWPARVAPSRTLLAVRIAARLLACASREITVQSPCHDHELEMLEGTGGELIPHRGDRIKLSCNPATTRPAARDQFRVILNRAYVPLPLQNETPACYGSAYAAWSGTDLAPPPRPRSDCGS
jgi:hypothetical protein